uniref:MIA SH3 domain containing n=1 Tax=Leptobrachium leishanense TaxID=445787 RepID=A0A8C5R8S3_9ANUR
NVWAKKLIEALSVCSAFIDTKMPKLADKKLCADEECSHPISMAVALADYIPPDCRFIPIRRGQTIYIYSKLRGRGRLFWSGSVSPGAQYGASRLGYFPSSIVQEEHYLMAGKVEVKTDVSLWRFTRFPSLITPPPQNIKLFSENQNIVSIQVTAADTALHHSVAPFYHFKL